MSYYKNVRVRNWNEPLQPSALDWSASEPASNSNLLGSLKNINWKQMLDQIGGIDGLVTRMNQVQKLISTVQQFAPMLKMFSGGLARRAPLATSDERDDEPFPTSTPRRRRTRKKGVSASRRKRRSF